MTDFLNIVNASFYKETRVHLTSNAHMPNRSKGFSSFKRNVDKEWRRKFWTLSDNCTKEDVDNAVKEFKAEIFKDLLGSTLIVHTNSNFTDYCEKNSSDEELQKLYKQNLTIGEYLHSGSKSKKFINMSDAFIDNNDQVLNHVLDEVLENSLLNKLLDKLFKRKSYKLRTLDIENISTTEDFYNQLIPLLTLLTSLSMYGVEHSYQDITSNDKPKNNPDESAKQRMVSEIDYPIYEIIKLLELSGEAPENDDFEFMRRIVNKNNELNSHKPFDVQLLEAIKNRKSASKKSDFKTLLSDKEKEKYLIILRHLKENLELLKNDRLHTYILQKELEQIVNRTRKLFETNDKYKFDIQIVSFKIVRYLNGYSSYHIILSINGTKFELQGKTEFRDDMTKEGATEHNSSLDGKLFDLTPFFELTSPTGDTKADDLMFETCLNFLSCMSNDSIKEPDDNNRTQIRLANLAKSQLKINEFYTIGDNSISYSPDNYQPNNYPENLEDIFDKYKKYYEDTFDERIAYLIKKRL